MDVADMNVHLDVVDPQDGSVRQDVTMNVEKDAETMNAEKDAETTKVDNDADKVMKIMIKMNQLYSKSQTKTLK